MQVAKHRVVTFDYKLTDEDGELIDSSEGSEPLVYLHGVGGIVPGLERALEGKSVGDRIQVTVAPEDGYGEQDDSLIFEVDFDQFEETDELELGQQFQIDTDDGPLVVTVVEITEDTVTIDGNHELAGISLNFDVTIVEVREATPEEIDHGHAHGEDDDEH